MNTGKPAQTITAPCGGCGKIITRRISQTRFGRLGKVPGGARIYCNRSCFKRPWQERFMSFVEKSEDPNGCWKWTGCLVGGYGKFPSPWGDMAHRIAYQMKYGRVGAGVYILHKCPGEHHTWCVNPDHLKAGTQKENVQDSIDQGTRVITCGENCHKSDLTPDKVREIRKRYASGESQKSIAISTGYSKYTIFDIIRHRSWNHIKD